MANEAGKKSGIKWSDNPAMVAQFEKEYEAWESGKEKGYGWVELKTEIAKLKLAKTNNRKLIKQ